MNNIKEYFLILDKLLELPTPKRSFIMELYRDMLHYYSEGRTDHATSYFNTLQMGGWLANRTLIEREQKLSTLTNEKS